MQNHPLFTRFSNFPKPLIGDWLVIFAGLIAVGLLFNALWTNQPASKLRIQLGDKTYGTYSLNQNKLIQIKSQLGSASIVIQNGQVRFQQSSCRNQYCVHQGWLKHAGQAAVCLPNQLSIELLGGQKPYDSLNY